jgi:hypothetical protein
MDFE